MAGARIVGGALCVASILAVWSSAAKAGPRPIDIAGGSLEQALVEVERQSGVSIRFEPEAVAGKRTAGCVRASDVPEALAQILRGSGLVYLMRGERIATVEDIVRVQAATELDEITVEGQGAGRVGSRGTMNSTGYGAADGFVASRSLTATKTDTPLIETPQSIAVIAADQIKAQGGQTLGQTLRYSAGLSGEVYGTDLRGFNLQIRGFNVSDEVFFRDGLRLSGSEFAAFLPLETYGAERVEVLRGPSSVLYGQAAPAGVINYVSKRPTDVAFGEISGSYGSFDRFQGEFDFGGPVEGTDGVWSYRFTGLARDGETMVRDFPDDRVFIAPAVTWKPSEDTTLTVLGNYQKDEMGYAVQFLPALGTLYRNNGRRISDRLNTGETGDHFDLEQASVGYMFEHRVNEALKVRQNARYAWLENDQYGAYGIGYADAAAGLLGRTADLGKSSIGAFAIDNQAQIDFDAGPFAHTLLVGADYRDGRYKDYGAAADIAPIDVFNPRYGARPGVFEAYQDTVIDQKQYGLYVQDQIKFGRLSLTIGGRADTAETDTRDRLGGGRTFQQDSDFTKRIGLVYLFDSGLAPYVNYAESFLPTVGFDEANGAFTPETGKLYEAGVKYQPPGWNSFVTASVFDLTRDNVLRYIPSDPSDPSGPLRTVQGGRVGVQGFELEGVASLDNGWNATLAYAYIDAKFESEDAFTVKGNTPLTVPTNRFSAWADYTVKSGALEGLGAGGGVRVTGRTWGDDANTFRVPAFTLFDAMVSYKRDAWKLQVNATNLLDKRHVAGCYDSDQCFYGDRRKVIAKITYAW